MPWSGCVRAGLVGWALWVGAGAAVAGGSGSPESPELAPSAGTQGALASEELGSPDAAPVAASSVPLRPVNVTCPVMLGNPVDVRCTLVWNGRCIAFCDDAARARWVADPARFAANIPSVRASANPILDAVRAETAPAPRGTPGLVAASVPAPRVIAGAAPVAAAAPLAVKGPPTPLAPARVQAPAPLRSLPLAGPASPAAAAPAPPAPPARTVVSLPPAPSRTVAVPTKAADAPAPWPIDLHGEGEDEDCECKDGSCRLPGK